jgi:hypothetical protein
MQQLHIISHIDAPTGACSRFGHEVNSAAPFGAGQAGENRLGQGTTGINRTTTGVQAHAAVRMHVSPATDVFWAYCLKDKATHFQRWKIAT